MNMKRILALALMALLLCLPVWAMADSAASYLEIVKSDGSVVDVTEVNADDVLGDGTVVYTPASGSNPAILRLTDASLAAIRFGDISSPELQIQLIGNSKITFTNAICDELGYESSCIDYDNNLEITGTGTLELTNDYSFFNTYYEMYIGQSCIFNAQNVTINGAQITASSKGGLYMPMIFAMGDLNVINNAKVMGSTNGTALVGYGSGGVNIDSSKVTVTNSITGIDSMSALTISGDSQVSVIADSVGLHSRIGTMIKDEAVLNVQNANYGIYNEQVNDVVISGKPTITLDTVGYGILNLGGDISVSEGLAVFAGEDEFTAVQLVNPENTDYEEPYVKILVQSKADSTLPSVPKTGDDSHIALWLMLMGVSAICLSVMVKRKAA